MRQEAAKARVRCTALRLGAIALVAVILGIAAGCDLLPDGGFRIGSLVKVVGTCALGLHVRDVAAGDVLSTVPDGWVFEILGGPEMAQLGGTTFKWWQVRDEQYDSPGLIGWVAERYLEQVTRAGLKPRNEVRYFSDGQARVLDAIDRANDYIEDETEWYTPALGYLCLRFVRQSYAGAPIPGWISARAALDALNARGVFYPAAESWNPPMGALVFFESNSSPEYDHVGLFLGLRQVAHVEGDRKAHVRDLGEIVQYSYIDEYLGWAYPPVEWLGSDDLLIAFFSNQDGNADIWVMAEDGTGSTRITSDMADDWDPDWSSDGATIVFETWRDGNAEIYLMSSSGSDQRNVTDHPAKDAHPDWSPDSSRIVFSSDRRDIGGTHDIYIMDPDGSGVVNLTEHPSYDWYPAWSPDGSKIAFASNRSGQFEVYVVSTDGTGLAQLTHGDGESNQPAWSPDGESIAYFHTSSGSRDIYVMDSDGSNKRKITSGSWEDNRDPSWAPGDKILFSSNQAGDFEIYSIDSDGSNERQLSYNAHDDFHPAWQPTQ